MPRGGKRPGAGRKPQPLGTAGLPPELIASLTPAELANRESGALMALYRAATRRRRPNVAAMIEYLRRGRRLDA